MAMVIWMILIIGSVVLLSWFVCRDMNAAIHKCLAIKKLHDAVAIGTTSLSDVAGEDLISLSRPYFTVVGMGGVGPCYNPSFSIWRLVEVELARRRSTKYIEWNE